jgi:hypothetical protein
VGVAVNLVGDSIENPANAVALREAALLFGLECRFRDERGRLADVSTVDTEALLSGGPIIAVDNAPGAESVYRTAPPRTGSSVVVGNERRGIRPDLLRAATRTVHIPMPGHGVDTLNVATAAAVALYYLLDARGRRPTRAPRPDAHRPAVLLAAPHDHVEAGSSLRTAAAFGWRTVTLDDREKVWFGPPRPVRAEARAAARSHRNPLRVRPGGDAGAVPPGARVLVCAPDADGPPVHRVDLTGAGTVLVVPDGPFRAPAGATYARVPPGRYRFRSGIVLAETARQLGVRSTAGRRPPRGLSYGSTLGPAPAPDTDLVYPDELVGY